METLCKNEVCCSGRSAEAEARLEGAAGEPRGPEHSRPSGGLCGMAVGRDGGLVPNRRPPPVRPRGPPEVAVEDIVAAGGHGGGSWSHLHLVTAAGNIGRRARVAT